MDFRGNVLGKGVLIKKTAFPSAHPLKFKTLRRNVASIYSARVKTGSRIQNLFLNSLDDKEGKCLITRLALEHRLLLVCVWRSPDNSSRTPESQPDLSWLYLASPCANLISRHACAQLFRFLGSVRHLTRLQLRVALWAPFGSSNSSPS